MSGWRARGGYGVKKVAVEIEPEESALLDLSAESGVSAKAMI